MSKGAIEKIREVMGEDFDALSEEDRDNLERVVAIQEVLERNWRHAEEVLRGEDEGI